ncbi:MAG: hypothetical protein ABIO24_13515 [Saprospiraceae bacterium]
MKKVILLLVAGFISASTLAHSAYRDRPCHPGGDIVPCGHAMHYAGDIVPCGHVCINNWGNAVPCHPGGDVVPCIHALHYGGDIVPCVHVCY